MNFNLLEIFGNKNVESHGSTFFCVVGGFVMADNFAETINKAMEIERKYQGIVW